MNKTLSSMQGRVVFSNYLLTLNSNLPDRRATRAGFSNAIQAGLYGAQDNAYQWLRIRDDGAFRPFARAERPLVMRIRMRAGLEHAGQRNGSPHAHILLEVTHRTNLRVDYNALQTAIYDAMARSGSMTRAQVQRQNFHVDFVPPGDVSNVLHYISKDGPQQASDPALRDANWGEVIMRSRPDDIFNAAYEGGTDTASMDNRGQMYTQLDDL